MRDVDATVEGKYIHSYNNLHNVFVNALMRSIKVVSQNHKKTTMDKKTAFYNDSQIRTN